MSTLPGLFESTLGISSWRHEAGLNFGDAQEVKYCIYAFFYKKNLFAGSPQTTETAFSVFCSLLSSVAVGWVRACSVGSS